MHKVRRSVFTPSFAGWIYAWAIATFASAMVHVGPPSADPELLAWIGQVFEIADEVPPGAKISFGLTLAAAYFLVGKIRGRALFAACGIAATLAAFVASVLLYPVDYYPDFGWGAFWPRHGAAAFLAGSAYVASVVIGRIRQERKK
ncbi:MAG: hypothetical protein V2I43_00700 [Parvularcula sp.]|jgi:hypothetical protein|nr:hypothetical protein [Parvularcula sp.]